MSQVPEVVGTAQMPTTVERLGRHATSGDVVVGVMAFVALLIVWQLVAMVIAVRILFPAPLEVLQKAIEMVAEGELQLHISLSLFRIAAGFAIGALIAIPTGLLMGTVVPVRRFVDPYVEFFRYIPALSLVTMALIWFGIGEASKIFLIVYGTTFIMVVNTAAGVRAIPVNRLRAAESLGASRTQTFFFVVLPSTMPFIYTGMRLALGNAFTTIVAAELVASQAGLGYVIFNARLFLETEAIFVAIITLGILGFLADRVLRVGFGRLAWRYVRDG